MVYTKQNNETLIPTGLIGQIESSETKKKNFSDSSRPEDMYIVAQSVTESRNQILNNVDSEQFSKTII